MSAEVGAATHVGRVRDRNEDAFYVDADRGLALIADGLGGHAAGDVASRIAIESISDALDTINGADPAAQLIDSLGAANDAILDDSSNKRERRGMGTTAVIAYLPAGRSDAWVAHVGDSRGYLLRDGQLIQITTDHTTGGPLGRGQITQALGSSGGVQPDCVHLELAAGDRLLLCTDGLTDMVTEAEIAEIAGLNDSPQDACDALVEAALTRGGVDNVTIVITDAGT